MRSMLVAEECRAVRENVGLLDISGFSRYEISGPNAETWLRKIICGRLPAPGRARLAPLLAPSGRLKGDLTAFNWGDGRWWLMALLSATGTCAGSTTIETKLCDWCKTFRYHRGLRLAGPNHEDVLALLTHQDVSDGARCPLWAATSSTSD